MINYKIHFVIYASLDILCFRLINLIKFVSNGIIYVNSPFYDQIFNLPLEVNCI